MTSTVKGCIQLGKALMRMIEESLEGVSCLNHENLAIGQK
jgi:hypothetical protein